MATADSSTVQVLIRARALIEQPEMWGKGASGVIPGTLCIVQAMGVAGGGWLNDETWNATRPMQVVTRAYKLDVWNDAPERTHEEILAAFDKAIALAKGEAS